MADGQLRSSSVIPATSPDLAHGRQEPSPEPIVPALARILALVLFAAIGFLPILRQGFIAWDDDVNFLENPDFRGLRWANLWWAWTTFHLEVYQPISWLSLELQYVLYGLNPAGYHLTSLAWHVFNAVLLYGLIVELLERVTTDPDHAQRWSLRSAAAIAAALWGTHPLRVEVVAWASSQGYLPCACFLLLALRAYLHAHPPVDPLRKVGSLWPASSPSPRCSRKRPASSCTALFVILDTSPLGRLPTDFRAWANRQFRAVWWEKLPLFVCSFVVMVLAVRTRS